MAGLPVEVQVRVNTGGSVAGSVFNWKVSSPGIVTWPAGGERKTISHMWQGPRPTVLVVVLPTTRISCFLK